MNYSDNPYASWGMIAADADTSERTRFIRLTYLHLAGAVLAFIGIEALILSLPGIGDMVAQVWAIDTAG